MLICSASVAVAAPRYEGCTKPQSAIIRTAIVDSKALAVVAAASVGDTPIYKRWFGKFSPAGAEKVRANMKSITRAVRTGAVVAQCDRVGGSSGCEQGTFAYVYDDKPYMVHICPPFFDLPSMANHELGSEKSANGTRAGTIIHELSHFVIVAGTEDECYSRDDCSAMARRSSSRAIRNADSYQYFAEDVTYETLEGLTP